MDIFQTFIPILWQSSIPGACGGLGTFLYSLRQKHYKNNRYVRKLIIEILGATLVASFIGPLFPSKVIVFASFAIGLAWVAIIQITRNKITKIVEVLIGEKIG